MVHKLLMLIIPKQSRYVPTPFQSEVAYGCTWLPSVRAWHITG